VIPHHVVASVLPTSDGYIQQRNGNVGARRRHYVQPDNHKIAKENSFKNAIEKGYKLWGEE
jgi:hypothetical protein